MADVIDFAASHPAMRAHAARALDRPSFAGLITKAGGLHPVILPPAGWIKEIHRRIDVAGGGKQVQLFRLLALEGETADVARGAQGQKVERNRASAEEHELIVAMPQGQRGAAQLHGIRICKRAEVTLGAVVGKAYQVVQKADVHARTAVGNASMPDIESVAALNIVVLNLRVDIQAALRRRQAGSS